MTELSFLLELLMNHKLPKATKDLILKRVKEVEESLYAKPIPMQRYTGPAQAASTLASFEKHGPLPSIEMPLMPAGPVEQIAQTPATAAALLHRQETISNALSGKVGKGETSPRKW